MKRYSLIFINTNIKRYKRIIREFKTTKRKAKDKGKINEKKSKNKDEDMNINNSLIS